MAAIETTNPLSLCLECGKYNKNMLLRIMSNSWHCYTTKHVLKMVPTCHGLNLGGK